MNRKQAINAVFNNPNLILMIMPGLVAGRPTEVWTTVDLTGVAKSQIDFVREHSKFEIAFNEDIFCCDKCEEMVAIFEENCPNCGAKLHFEEEYA